MIAEGDRVRACGSRVLTGVEQGREGVVVAIDGTIHPDAAGRLLFVEFDGKVRGMSLGEVLPMSQREED